MGTDLTDDLKNPTFQAFAPLRTVFTVAPILSGRTSRGSAGGVR